MSFWAKIQFKFGFSKTRRRLVYDLAKEGHRPALDYVAHELNTSSTSKDKAVDALINCGQQAAVEILIKGIRNLGSRAWTEGPQIASINFLSLRAPDQLIDLLSLHYPWRFSPQFIRAVSALKHPRVPIVLAGWLAKPPGLPYSYLQESKDRLWWESVIDPEIRMALIRLGRPAMESLVAEVKYDFRRQGANWSALVAIGSVGYPELLQLLADLCDFEPLETGHRQSLAHVAFAMYGILRQNASSCGDSALRCVAELKIPKSSKYRTMANGLARGELRRREEDT